MSTLKDAYRTIVHDHFPDEMTITLGDQKLVYRKRVWRIEDEGEWVERGLRYGENPGQEAALYELTNGNLVLGDCRFIDPGRGLVSAIDEAAMRQFGKHPGKINLTDVDAALNILKHLMDRPAAAVMKHNNPSGVAYGAGAGDAIRRAYMTDRLAAMGGCVCVNRPLDKPGAEFLAENYVEVVAAPSFDEGVIALLAKSKNLRIVEIPRIDRLAEWREQVFLELKSLIDGGIVAQQSQVTRIRTARDFLPAAVTHKGVEHRCQREPTAGELDDLLFGWSIELGVTSNSVMFVKDGVTLAIGTGEQDRVGSAQIAVHKAYTKAADGLCFAAHAVPYNVLALEVRQGKRPAAEKDEIDAQVARDHGGLSGSAMVSDGFFPFRDGVDVGINEGVTAIAQPGGSVRDYEVIDACNEARPQVAMVFTGQRAFKH